MRAKEIEVGGVYAAKVSGRVVPVRIVKPSRKGWLAINTRTGREIHIKSAQRLRHQIEEREDDE